MSVIDSLLRVKAFEDQQEQRDISAIGNAVNNFITGSEIRRQREREDVLDSLKASNILSQIEARESGSIDDLLKGVELKRQGIELEDENLFAIGQAQINKTLSGGKTSVNQFLEPVASQGMPTTIIDDSLLQEKPSQETAGFQGLVARERERKAQEKQQSAELEVGKQVSAQRGKAQEKATRDIQRAATATDTAFDEVVRFNEEQFERFGVKPGAAFGMIDKLTPKQLNQFKAGAVGAGREASATVGMSIIPAARAVRMVEIFSKSSAEIGNTIEGNANNIAASMGNVFGRAITDNIPMETNDGQTVPIQSITLDPVTGKMISEITDFGERLNALNRVKRQFRDDVKQKYIVEVFKRNPDLLKKETVEEILDNQELVDQLLSEE